MRIDGTPMTMRLPPWPPEAKRRYSSFFPVGVYVFSAATTSASDRPRRFMRSASEVPPDRLLAEAAAALAPGPGESVQARASATLAAHTIRTMGLMGHVS